MSDGPDRLINLLGAFAVGVADQVHSVAADETALGGEAAAALVVIGHTPNLSVNRLSQILRLSQPGTVRLVDRLVATGFAVRSATPHDRRAVAVNLTDEGRARRAMLLSRRREALKAILEAVAAKDLAVLERVTEAMLRSLPIDATSALSICRFCDELRCPNCPMHAEFAV